MKKVVMGVMVAIMAVSIGLSSAEAKRMGSGSSVGKQSQSVNQSSPAQSAQSPAAMQSAAPARPGATPAAAAPKPASPWKGMLGGALLGLGLGALLSSMGIGGALASMISTMLMVGLLVVAGLFIYRMLKRKSDGGSVRPAYATAAAGAGAGAGAAPSSFTPEIGSHVEPLRPAALQSAQPAASGSATSDAPWGVPADFDTPAFLRHAKTYFIRLQAAWDKADVNDIREFTSPEMFAELRMQIQERGASANHTDVVSLDAQLLGIETSGPDHLASVKFSGMIREALDAPAEPFAEVWNLTKPSSGQGGWTLAGIQQIS
ncbi:Tim44 domain-containing protein [Noviherbaspirillum suwonense]|uniref:Predicted lipid-binding transport protein, Tim44 family n=1 Tax=Noviherbaspirillum suwonense TaxID=1224511 RepID=A0ABY1QR23_9BURK|nr:Tim44-like domain-containing protein [Noviherbaspirillum suwonense]SMP77932.1 Predicted lipid-binding transport protein, Tim44 family [Noviherbaspirillum suwonense]